MIITPNTPGGWGWRLPPSAEDERSVLQCAQHESLWCRPERGPHRQLGPRHLREGELVRNNDWKQQPPLHQVGRGVAHDEYIEFSIEGNTILYQVLHPPRKQRDKKSKNIYDHSRAKRARSVPARSEWSSSRATGITPRSMPSSSSRWGSKSPLFSFSNCPPFNFQIVHYSVFKLSTFQFSNCPLFNC